MADNHWVRCNMCMRVYDDLDIRECEECQTDAYLMDVEGE